MAKKTASAKKNEKVIDKESFRLKYNELRPKYERLAVNLQQAIKAFLEERNIPYLDVIFRIKDADSAYEKIGRKEISDPFVQIEDWCGLRVICYYPSDVENICDIIREEFDVISQEDTAKRLALKEFGYRSTHFIIKVKPSWLQPPNYRGLVDIKAEVQVRTILMHAWAEVEHKMQYKSAEQVPEKFQRKLYLLSAKFEEADGQFEELRDGINAYRASLRENIAGVSSFVDQEFNLDTLQAFLDIAFPDKVSDKQKTSDLFIELEAKNIHMKKLVFSYESIKKIFPKLEHAWNSYFISDSGLAQVGAARLMLDITNKNYREERGFIDDGSGWDGVVKIGLDLLEKEK